MEWELGGYLLEQPRDPGGRPTENYARPGHSFHKELHELGLNRHRADDFQKLRRAGWDELESEARAVLSDREIGTAQAHALGLEKPAEPVGTAGPGRGHKTHVDNRGFIGSTNAEYLTGRIEPITLYEGMILDGRNRYRACIAVGVKPTTDQYEGDDPVGFVMSKNLNRRQLTDDQRALAKINSLPMIEAEAKKRQGNAGQPRTATVVSIRTQRSDSQPSGSGAMWLISTT